MVNKKRINALASLAEDMNVQTHVRANEKKISSIPKETGPKVKTKSRKKTNDTCYQKTEIIKMKF